MNVILEFNGLPATGKSTIAKELLNSLNDCGIKCCSSYRRHSRYIKLEKLCSIGCWKVYLTSLCFTLSLKPRCEEQYGPKKFVQYYKTYKDFLSNNDNTILIKDQGFFQNIISAIHLRTMGNTRCLLKLIRSFSSIGMFFIRIDCDADIDTVYSRLTSRTNGKSRFDKITDGSAKQKMTYQKEHFSIVRSLFSQVYSKDSVIQIDTSNTVDYNVNVIKEHLLKLSIINH